MMFSIIIPVYQVEKYLEQCLESVLNQNFTDYEVILIDDGSKDNSGKICDDYASKYSNIEVIHQTNSGLSVARNKGIEKAKGDYLIFIDSDDYIASNSFEQINQELKQSHFPDILITPFKSFRSSGMTKDHDLFLLKHDVNTMNIEEAINLQLKISEGLFFVWRYIVKKNLIESHQIQFPVGMLYEDNQWTPRVLLFAKTFSVLKYCWYYYRTDSQNSITNNIRFQNTMDQITILANNIQYIQRKSSNSFLTKILTRRLSKEFLDTLLIRYHKLCIEDKRKIVEFNKKHQKSFKKHTSFKYLLFFTFTELFGLDLCLKIYRKFIILKERFIYKVGPAEKLPTPHKKRKERVNMV